MSLKVELLLEDDTGLTKREPRIYTTGAFLVPMRVRIGDKERFLWVVENFNDDTYWNGRTCNPMLYANELQDLLQVA